MGGFPKIVQCVRAVAAIFNYIEVPSTFIDLCCEPFWNGYDSQCYEARLVISIQDSPSCDVHGQKEIIHVYIICGEYLRLLGNNVIRKFDLFGSQNLLIVPRGVLGSTEASPKMITDGKSDGPRRTYLYVLLTKTTSIR